MADGVKSLLFEGENNPITLEADGAIFQYALVDIDASGRARLVGAAATNTNNVAGVAMEAASAAGDRIPIATAGVVVCVADAAVTQGADVTGPTTTAGRAAVGTSGTDAIFGQALTAAGAAGDHFQLLISRA